MALEYHLIPNHIKPESDHYLAISKHSKSATLDDLFDGITREGSTITKAEALAVFEEITQRITEFVQEGYSVKTPLVNIRSDVKGKFVDDEDNFDPGRHKVKINVTAGKRLRAISSDIKPVKIFSQKPLPKPLSYYDQMSDTTNNIVTPGDAAKLTGLRLKFDEDDPEQGVYFINKDTREETKVERSMLTNMPSELIFMNPDLPSGTYLLEIRSIVYNTGHVRTGRLSKQLRVKE